MARPPVPRSEPIEPRLTKFNITTRRYSDADIVALETSDLTDPMIVGALQEAYRQQDPDGGQFAGFRRDPSEGTFGDEPELNAMLKDVENKLKAKPKDFMNRARRLSILRHIACLRKHAEQKKSAHRTSRTNTANLVEAAPVSTRQRVGTNTG